MRHDILRFLLELFDEYQLPYKISVVAYEKKIIYRNNVIVKYVYLPVKTQFYEN